VADLIGVALAASELDVADAGDLDLVASGEPAAKAAQVCE
jgi:hypothetical protein